MLDNAGATHEIATHFLDEARRIEGRIEALAALSRRCASTVGTEAECSSLPIDDAVELARRAIMEAAAEARRFLACQSVALRPSSETFADWAAAFPTDDEVPRP